jgi:hypothetical protein
MIRYNKTMKIHVGLWNAKDVRCGPWKTTRGADQDQDGARRAAAMAFDPRGGALPEVRGVNNEIAAVTGSVASLEPYTG